MQRETKQIIASVKEQLQTELPNKIANVILFGSHARGNHEEGSDIDIVLVLKEKMSRKQSNKIKKILSEISLHYDAVVSCIVFEKEEFHSRNTPFLLNVKKEGIAV